MLPLLMLLPLSCRGPPIRAHPLPAAHPLPVGNGAKFYGKRKSSFYGDDDQQRKSDPSKSDSEEDYSGPMGGSFFVLSKEKDEQGRPMGFLTRGEARALKEMEENEYWQEQRSSQDMLSSFKNEATKRDDA